MTEILTADGYASQRQNFCSLRPLLDLTIDDYVRTYSLLLNIFPVIADAEPASIFLLLINRHPG